MAISDVSFMGNQEDPFSKLTKALDVLGTLELDAQFIDKNGKISLTRDYLEMIISKYAQSTQNSSIFNKFLGFDTKLEKALKEYKADLQIMISGLASMGSAQQTINAPIPGMAAMPEGPQGQESPVAQQQSQSMGQAQQQANARALPTQ